MSREICKGTELYAFIGSLGQYRSLTVTDCNILVEIALERYHSSLYVTENNFLVYDCWDGCFCVNPISLCRRLIDMLLNELKISPDNSLKRELSQLYSIVVKEKMSKFTEDILIC